MATDNHLAAQPPLQLLDRDDDTLYIGIKVSISWIKLLPAPAHNLLLAILGLMTLPPPI